ncbi:MAG: hypothetical protein DCC65_16345 [Planctomycetota bacterium]|nr:MAG: hypothetical protein DCC65_16345 [Planctomycetota bacterium]
MNSRAFGIVGILSVAALSPSIALGQEGDWVQRIPFRREGCALAYDSGRGVVILFGGHTSNGLGFIGYLNDTWEWNGSQCVVFHAK